MKGEQGTLLGGAAVEAIGAGILPYVRAIPTMAPELHVVPVGCVALFEDKHKFMLRAV